MLPSRVLAGGQEGDNKAQRACFLCLRMLGASDNVLSTVTVGERVALLPGPR